MNPSFDKGRARSSRRVSSFVWSVSRMRKECVCEPWSNWAESGNEENALQTRIKLRCEEIQDSAHTYSLSRGEIGSTKGRRMPRWDQVPDQNPLEYDQSAQFLVLSSVRTDCNSQDPTPKANKLFGLKNESFHHGIFELDRGGCDQRCRDRPGTSEGPLGEDVFLQ